MKKFLFATLLFCSFATYSQINFEKGYFINNNGVRIDCFIENVDWSNNPKSFTYKLLETDPPKNENYMGVREFGIDNVSMYKRFTVKVERSSTEKSSLSKTNVIQWKEETLFLKALVTGDASLYVLNDSNITKYFFETKHTPIEQLIHLKYLNTGNYLDTGTNSYGETIKENNQFRQQLLNTIKCATSESDFSKLQYKKLPLVSLFVKYNNCSSSNTASATVNFAEKDKYKVFSLKVTPGIYAGSISITDPETAYNVSSDFNAIVFKIGAEAEFTLPFNKNTWSIFVNPTFENFSTEKSFSKSDGFPVNPGIVNYDAVVKYSAIEIPLGLRHYFFLNQSSKIFVNAAYVATVSLSGKAEFTNTQHANANNSVDLSGRGNLALGVGYSYKKFSAEVRFNTKREVSSYIEWHAAYNTTGLVLGYTLF
jgi:hypothetical protein